MAIDIGAQTSFDRAELFSCIQIHPPARRNHMFFNIFVYSHEFLRAVRSHILFCKATDKLTVKLNRS
jgi:hypothetical protein